MPDPLEFHSTTARFDLPLLIPGQANKELFHNEALARIDALLHPSITGEARFPPETPTEGESWLVGADPGGEWQGREGLLAMRQQGQWLFAKPSAGMRLLDRSSGQFLVFFDGWQKPASIPEPTGGLYVDSEARAAIGALLSALRASGILPSA